MNTIAEDYDDWVDDTGVQLIAVSIDDARSTSRVEPYVNAQGWDYQVLLDPNGDLKRAMNVNNVPHTFLVKNGAIVWDHNNYSPGDEKSYIKKFLNLLNENQITFNHNCIFLGQQLVLSQLDDNDVDIGTFSGNIQAIAQYYQEDTLINAALPEQLMGLMVSESKLQQRKF